MYGGVERGELPVHDRKDFTNITGFLFELLHGAWLRENPKVREQNLLASEPVLNLWGNNFHYFDAIEYEILGDKVILNHLYEVKSGPSIAQIRKFERWMRNVSRVGVLLKDEEGRLTRFKGDQIRMGESERPLSVWLKDISKPEHRALLSWVTTPDGHVTQTREEVQVRHAPIRTSELRNLTARIGQVMSTYVSIYRQLEAMDDLEDHTPTHPVHSVSSLKDLDRWMSSKNPPDLRRAFMLFVRWMQSETTPRLELEFFKRYAKWPEHFKSTAEVFYALRFSGSEILDLAAKAPLSLVELHPKTLRLLRSSPPPQVATLIKNDPGILDHSRKRDLEDCLEALQLLPPLP